MIYLDLRPAHRLWTCLDVPEAPTDQAKRLCATPWRAMQLELLLPRTWQHPNKEFLKAWYHRCGYRAVRTTRMDDAYPHLAPYLATECDLVVYEKALQLAPGRHSQQREHGDHRRGRRPRRRAGASRRPRRRDARARPSAGTSAAASRPSPATRSRRRPRGGVATASWSSYSPPRRVCELELLDLARELVHRTGELLDI